MQKRGSEQVVLHTDAYVLHASTVGALEEQLGSLSDYIEECRAESHLERTALRERVAAVEDRRSPRRGRVSRVAS